MTVGSDAHGRPVVVPDPLGTAPGRGAPLPPTTECYELAVRRKAFGRALRLSTDGVPGGLDSAAVGAYVATRMTGSEDRQEGWSSSS